MYNIGYNKASPPVDLSSSTVVGTMVAKFPMKPTFLCRVAILILLAIFLVGTQRKFDVPPQVERANGVAANFQIPRIVKVKLAGTVIEATIASTTAEQGQGLGGVTALPETKGMLFPFSTRDTHTFWNKGMLISFDLLWISGETVIGIEESVPPEAEGIDMRTSPDEVTSVLELRGGWARDHGLKAGDIVETLD